MGEVNGASCYVFVSHRLSKRSIYCSYLHNVPTATARPNVIIVMNARYRCIVMLASHRMHLRPDTSLITMLINLNGLMVGFWVRRGMQRFLMLNVQYITITKKLSFSTSTNCFV